MNKKQLMYENMQAHGNNLNAIFKTDLEPIELCKKLLRLEKKAHHATTCLCNTNTLNILELNKYTGYNVEQVTEEQEEKFFNDILKKVYKILGEESKNIVFVNFDARGYALKIRSEASKNLNIFKDWGGYGILAPDFR